MTRKEFLANIKPMFQFKSLPSTEKLFSFTKRGNGYGVAFDMTIKMFEKEGKKSIYNEVGIDTWQKINNK